MIQVRSVFLQNTSYLTLKENFFHKPSMSNLPPKITQIVIRDDDRPAPMIVPDPRAFALNKFWLSNQDDREPVKKHRNRGQAITMGKLVLLNPEL